MNPLREELLSREWFRGLTPIEQMRKDCLWELRERWCAEDDVCYLHSVGIPGDSLRAFAVLLPLPRRAVGEPMLDTLTVEQRVVRPELYRLPDGRDLFYAGRCPETATVYVRNAEPPIDYARLGPDLLWMLQLWQNFGRTGVPAVEAAIRGLCS